MVERPALATGEAVHLHRASRRHPRAAADLGLQLKRLQAQRRYDWSKLTPQEKTTVDKLIAKAETVEGAWPHE
jgi:hypothetical protein